VRLDLSFVLWVGSLVLSACAVVLFLWLMRAGGREPENGKRETKEADS